MPQLTKGVLAPTLDAVALEQRTHVPLPTSHSPNHPHRAKVRLKGKIAHPVVFRTKLTLIVGAPTAQRSIIENGAKR